MAFVKRVDLEEVIKGLEVLLSPSSDGNITIYVKGQYTDTLGKVHVMVRTVPFFCSADKKGHLEYYSFSNEGNVL